MCDEPSTGTGSGPSDVPGPRESSHYPLESFEHLPEERAYRATFDADEVAPSIAVVAAVSGVVDADPTSRRCIRRSTRTRSTRRSATTDPCW